MSGPSELDLIVSPAVGSPAATVGRVLVPPTSSLSQHPPSSSSSSTVPHTTATASSSRLGPRSSPSTLEPETSSYQPTQATLVDQTDSYDRFPPDELTSSSSTSSSSTSASLPAAPPPPLPSPPPAAPSPFEQALDQAYTRYVAAIDAIAAKYAHSSGADEDAEEVEVCFDDLVVGMVQGLDADVTDEPGETGEDEAEVGEGEGDEDEDESERAKGNQASRHARSTLPGGGQVFRSDGAPTWCWVEPDTPFSSDIVSALLQNSASLTPSLTSATHILLSPNLPTGPSSSTSSLSVLHRSILEQQLPHQHIITFDWVRDCVTTGVRLREVGYEVRWDTTTSTAREPPVRGDLKGKGKGTIRQAGGWSSTAPGRIERKEEPWTRGGEGAASPPRKRQSPVKSSISKPRPRPNAPPRPLSPPAPPPPPLRPSQLLLPLRPAPLLSTSLTNQPRKPTAPTPSVPLSKLSLPPLVPPPLPAAPSTKRPRVLGVGMSRLNKVPRLLSCIRGVGPAVAPP